VRRLGGFHGRAESLGSSVVLQSEILRFAQDDNLYFCDDMFFCIM